MANTKIRNRDYRSYIALVFGIISLGLSPIFLRMANAPGPVASFYRMLIGTIVLAVPFFYRARKTTGGLSRKGIKLAVIGGLFFAGDLVFWATGVMIGGATIPTLLSNVAPLWVGIAALVIFKEKLRPLFWVGLAIAMSGAVLILGNDLLNSATFGLGSLLGLLSSLFYCGYFVMTQMGRKYLGPLSYFWPAALSGTIVLLIYNLIMKLPLTGYSSTTYLWFLANGLITQVIGYLCVNYALGHLPASIVSPTLLGQPVVTALIAWPLLSEVLSPMHFLGGAAILAGVIMVHRSQESTRQ
ncbi:MAG TPA: hypothetical protein DHD79_02015 [Firmicutes bacterium]|jgi:drug/metabolite transporter (DMT)-like permease|nr:hypothetical protein [Bacillota bacterium]HBG44830.1 hypothetical protein [Bacillota bacterium]HCF88573.1 hypothetical protein [Bacillota bacterium]HCX70000.1 hypothetical protein [Bacillota bacterium]